MLLVKRRILAAAIESTPGTAETLDAGDAALNVFDVVVNPNIEMSERMGQSTFSPLPAVPGARAGTLAFKVNLHGSGASGGASPDWADTLLPACGLVETDDVFQVNSSYPSAAGSVKTVTLGVYEQGLTGANALMKKLKGAMGTASFHFEPGKIGYVEFTFTGIWLAPTDATMLAPTYPTVIPPRLAGSATTIGAWSPKYAELSLDLGNDVQLREDPSDASGYLCAYIGGRTVTGTLNPEADLVTDRDSYGTWLAGTEAALSAQLGAGGDDFNTLTFAALKAQLTNVQEGDRNGNQIDDITFQCNRSAAGGDDELTITFS